MSLCTCLGENTVSCLVIGWLLFDCCLFVLVVFGLCMCLMFMIGGVLLSWLPVFDGNGWFLVVDWYVPGNYLLSFS